MGTSYSVSLPKKALLEYFFLFLLKNTVFCNLQSRMNSLLGLCLAAMTIACVWSSNSKTTQAHMKWISKCYSDKDCLCVHCQGERQVFARAPPSRKARYTRKCECEKWRPGVERERDQGISPKLVSIHPSARTRRQSKWIKCSEMEGCRAGLKLSLLV